MKDIIDRLYELINNVNQDKQFKCTIYLDGYTNIITSYKNMLKQDRRNYGN